MKELTEHTPVPYRLDFVRITPDSPIDGFAIRAGRKNHSIASTNCYENGAAYVHEDFHKVVDMEEEFTREEMIANAEFLVRAANAHDSLVAACEAVIDNCDGVPYRVIDELRAAVALAGKAQP